MGERSRDVALLALEPAELELALRARELAWRAAHRPERLRLDQCRVDLFDARIQPSASQATGEGQHQKRRERETKAADLRALRARHAEPVRPPDAASSRSAGGIVAEK